MRLHTISCGIVALLSTSVLADTIPARSASPSVADYRAAVTPFPQLVEDDAHIEIRQNLQVQPDATLASGQVPPVTIYTIATQVGATGVETVYTYTQRFSPVPDQWPSAKAGTIGFGTLHNKKREAQPVNTVIVETEQPIVMVQEMEVVTIPLQRVTEVLVVRSVLISNSTTFSNVTAFGNTTAMNNVTAQIRNESLMATLNSAAFRPLYTAF